MFHCFPFFPYGGETCTVNRLVYYFPSCFYKIWQILFVLVKQWRWVLRVDNFCVRSLTASLTKCIITLSLLLWLLFAGEPFIKLIAGHFVSSLEHRNSFWGAQFQREKWLLCCSSQRIQKRTVLPEESVVNFWVTLQICGLVAEQWESFRHWDKHIVKIDGQGWCQKAFFLLLLLLSDR